MADASGKAGRALVFGTGKSGAAVAALLTREGCAVTVLDGAAAFPEGAYDFAVTSPGVALSHPWHAAARARRIPVVSELQIGVTRWRRRGGRLLAVTGSKGKSSVVKLVADTLAMAGHPAVACGNYGTPLCAVLAACRDALPWGIVEVSSFQMETTFLKPDAFEAAALLNLQDDHLDRHGTRAVYHGLKRRLLTYAKVPVDMTRAEGVAGDEGARALFAGSYFDNPILAANGRAAVMLLRAAGLRDAAIAAGFKAFAPLPHRMSEVCVRAGVRYVDDSKATSIAALCAGVTMAAGRGPGRCRLIAGGLDKGDDPKSAIPLLQSGVEKVYLIGRCAERFRAAWSKTVPCEMCGTLEHAVAAARRDACAGETVLLSPGTASFDQFGSFTERGDAFRAFAQQGTEK